MHNFKPSAQINPKSYLGVAFKEAKEFKIQTQGGCRTHGKVDLTSEDSDSESSNLSYNSGTSDNSSMDPLSDSDISTSDPDSSDSSSESSLDPDMSDDSYKYYKQRHKKSKKYRKNKGKKRTKKSLLKPIPPDKYDGMPDTQLFHKFMTQLMAYLEDVHIPEHCHIYILSNYLTEKVYTFYTRDIACDPKQWTAAKFLKALFDNVFPVNFRLKQHEKLDKFYQNNKTVKTYVAKLAELFMSIGFLDDHERVHKLWKGLHCDIQRELWKEK